VERLDDMRDNRDACQQVGGAYLSSDFRLPPMDERLPLSSELRLPPMDERFPLSSELRLPPMDERLGLPCPLSMELRRAGGGASLRPAPPAPTQSEAHW
jgi:hypothetical protein